MGLVLRFILQFRGETKTKIGILTRKPKKKTGKKRDIFKGEREKSGIVGYVIVACNELIRFSRQT
jgi:hypothetical protein